MSKLPKKPYYEQKYADVHARYVASSDGLSPAKSIDGTVKRTGCLRCSPHLHREIELVFFWGGYSVAYTDSARAELEPGDVFISFPNQIHYYESPLPDTENYHLFIVNPDIVPELSDKFQGGVPASPIIKGLGNQPLFRETVDAMYNAARQSKVPYAVTMRNGYLQVIFSMILSHMTLSEPLVGDSGALRAIVSYCTRHFAENLSLSVLEDELHLNKYYISHLFSGKLKLRFNDYVNSLRISEACRMLTGTDLSVTQISETVGFNTLRTFNRAFVKELGVSPSEYRRQGGLAIRPRK